MSCFIYTGQKQYLQDDRGKFVWDSSFLERLQTLHEKTVENFYANGNLRLSQADEIQSQYRNSIPISSFSKRVISLLLIFCLSSKSCAEPPFCLKLHGFATPQEESEGFLYTIRDGWWQLTTWNLQLQLYRISCKSDDDPSLFLLQEQVLQRDCFDLAFNYMRAFTQTWRSEKEQIHVETLVLLLKAQRRCSHSPALMVI